MRESTSPRSVSTMTGSVRNDGSERIAFSSASPSTCGMTRSVSTRLGRRRSNDSSAARPSATISTSYRSDSNRRMNERISALSSASSTRGRGSPAGSAIIIGS